MPFTHLLVALLLIMIWGINLIFIKVGLAEVSPLLLCAIRFFLASIPAIFFIKPPAAPFKMVALYGLVMFALQFSFIFTGMNVGMTAGMTSVIMQVQVFFSMLFAAILLSERPSAKQIIGALISFSGIVLLAMHVDQTMSLLGFMCVIAGAASWGMGNLISKKLKTVNMLALVVWGSFVACCPMFILSFLIEGTDSILYTYHHLTWLGGTSILYIVYMSTLAGYGIWNWLLSHHPVSVVAPFTLLIPIVATFSSVLILDETLNSWKLGAGALVIGGLVFTVFGKPFSLRRLFF